jgi:hypothetical protein
VVLCSYFNLLTDRRNWCVLTSQPFLILLTSLTLCFFYEQYSRLVYGKDAYSAFLHSHQVRRLDKVSAYNHNFFFLDKAVSFNCFVLMKVPCSIQGY